jgi:hypothetical protein
MHNIKNPLKSRIYEQIAKYLTADNSVVHNIKINTAEGCIRIGTSPILWYMSIYFISSKKRQRMQINNNHLSFSLSIPVEHNLIKNRHP